MDATRQDIRYNVVQRREFLFNMVPFKTLASVILIAHVVDLSKHGIGIESSHRLEPGFVWFRDRISGFKSGLIVWVKQTGGKHRAGIRFVPLSQERELFVQEQIALMRPNEPIRNPEALISTILDSLTQGDAGAGQTGSRPTPPELQSLRSPEGTPTEEDIIAQLREMLSSL